MFSPRLFATVSAFLSLSTSGGAALVNEAKLLPQADPGQGNAIFGATVAVDGDTLVVGSPREDTAVQVGGAVYVFVRSGTSWLFQQKLIASDSASNDYFGTSVSIQADTIVVGSPFHNTAAGADAGSAYVFVRAGTVWTEQQHLFAPDGASGDRFGWSVSVDGDTTVVGAYLHDTAAGSDAGSAYVFLRSGTVWGEQQTLTPLDHAAGDLFGASVALNADTIVSSGSSTYAFVRTGSQWTEQQKMLDSDEAPVRGRLALDGDTVVMGQPFDVSDVGSALVFVRSGTVWSEQQTLLASDGAPADFFGWSVSVDGDTAVVGAVQGLTETGSAYVFVRSGTTWTEQQKLLAADAKPGDFVGVAVSVSGETAVVGAQWDDTVAGIDAGSADVFDRAAGQWSEQQKLLPPPAFDGARFDHFGDSVAMEAETLVVGAPFDDTTGDADAGSAYVFVRVGTVWNLQQKIFPPEDAVFTGFGLAFGSYVATSGDTLVVSAPWDAFDVGAVWVFVRSGAFWAEEQKLTPSVAGDSFGPVSIVGDTLVVGAGSSSTGAAYVFVRSGGIWVEQQRLFASDAAAGDGFGGSVWLSGDTVVVGAALADTGAGTDAGSAYVFVRSGVTWTEQQKLTASDGMANAQFGWSVALDADTAVIGAPERTGNSTGSAYAFVRSGITWTEQQKLAASDGVLNAEFGFSVSVDGDSAAIGADNSDGDLGAAYTYSRTGTVWTEVGKLMPTDPTPFEQFGRSVAVKGNTVTVGAWAESSPSIPLHGSAYVFRQITATDVAVAKTDGQTTAVPGVPVTYTISVSDSGPDPGVGVRVTDLPPFALTNVTWTCSATPGSSCPASGSGPIDHTVNVDVSGMLSYSLTGTVASSATGSLVNTATVAAPAGVTDPIPANNAATDTDVLTPQADLAVGLAGLPDPVRSEGTLIYSLDITNAGPSDSTGMTASQTLPPETTFVSSVPGPPTCVHAAGTVTCGLAGGAPSGSQTVTIQALVHPGTVGTISGTAAVAGNEPDPVASNDSATETTQAVLGAATELIHGSLLWADLASVVGLADQDDYRIGQGAYASYEVVVDGTSGDVGSGQGPELERVASDGVTVLQSSVGAGAGSSRSLRWENAGSAPVNGEYVRVRSAGCTSSCGVEDVYRVRAWETTLRASRFNNSATQLTVLVIQNPGAVSVAGHVYFWSPSGSLLGSQAFALGPNQALALNTSAVSGVAGQSGSITLSHDGPFGGLAGKAVAVEPATGFTFDTPLLPRPLP